MEKRVEEARLPALSVFQRWHVVPAKMLLLRFGCSWLGSACITLCLRNLGLARGHCHERCLEQPPAARGARALHGGRTLPNGGLRCVSELGVGHIGGPTGAHTDIFSCLTNVRILFAVLGQRFRGCRDGNHNGCRTHPYFRPNNHASAARCVGQHSNLHTVPAVLLCAS